MRAFNFSFYFSLNANAFYGHTTGTRSGKTANAVGCLLFPCSIVCFHFARRQIDFCANNPCPEGHQCSDHGNDFSCDCPEGRNGPDCSQVPRTVSWLKKKCFSMSELHSNKKRDSTANWNSVAVRDAKTIFICHSLFCCSKNIRFYLFDFFFDGQFQRITYL